MKSSTAIGATAIFLTVATVCASSQTPGGSESKPDFVRDIRPILAQHCTACHGPDENSRKAGLRLDVRENAVAKKAIVPGNVSASTLIARIESADDSHRMPPPESKKTLSNQQKKLLRTWIEQDATYAQHWAFTPPRRPAIPQPKTPTGNAIDAFVLQRLERENLNPSPEADRATLLRRVTLDLTGLPPTLKELEDALSDKSPEWYDKVVDRLLASPRYAERMAMAWLDAARYADSNGFNNDEARAQWPWRDWVIDAFQRNLSYDRFIVEQIAGDLLPNATVAQKVATAFHRNQVYNTEGGIIPEEYRVEYVADRVHTTATVFLGLSMQCARCHDHKYDPITQREYYQFSAYFNSIVDKPTHAINLAAGEPFIRIASPDLQARLAKLEQQRLGIQKQIEQHEAGIDDAVSRWERALQHDEIAKLVNTGPLLHLPLDEKNGNVAKSSASPVRGTIHGKANWSTGKVNGALDFDGNTYVALDSAPTFDSDTPFSIGVWANPTAKTGMALLSKMDDAAAYRGYDLLFEDGKVVVHLIHRWADNAIKVSTKNPVTPNAWHHVLVTYNGSKKAAGLKIYVDGKLEALTVLNDSLKGSILTDKPAHLGRRQSSLPFRGKLDDVQYFTGELNAENAGQLAAGHPVTTTSQLLAVRADKRTPAQQSQVRRFYLDRIDKEYSKLKTELADVIRQKAEAEKTPPAVMIMQDLPKPRDTYLLKRGAYDQRGEKVSFGVPTVLNALPNDAPTNRLGLAQWLVNPANPLTARVAVNRWWQMYFGTGLVKTLEDFGVTGEPPSHPELLDYLATELVRGGWDVKAMQRLIVMSATYRQSSRFRTSAFGFRTGTLMPAAVLVGGSIFANPQSAIRSHQWEDPENRLLARGPRYRLSAETVRDNALAISGLLKDKIGGPSVKPYQPAGLWEDVTVSRGGKYVPDKGDGLYRRSMYTFWKRTCPPPAMQSFDAPNREVCVARRAVTNTPLQALVLLNDPTYIESARRLAERLLKDGGQTIESRLACAFKCAVSRPPNADEQRILLAIFREALSRYSKDQNAAKQLLAVGESVWDATLDPIDLATWTTVASTILNMDETISKR